MKPQASVAALCAILLACSAPMARAADEADFPFSPNLNDKREMVTKDGFSAQFWLIDSVQFFFSWTFCNYRNLQVAPTIRRTKPVYLALFIANPGEQRIPASRFVRGSNRALVTYEYEIIKPNGALYGAVRSVAWDGPAPTRNLVALAVTRPSFTFEALDAAGTYTVNLMVHDKVRNVDIPLRRTITLVE